MRSTQPGPVRAAVILMSLVGVGYLVDAAALVGGAGAFAEQFRQAAQESGVDPRAVALVGPAATALPYVMAALTAGAAVFLLVVAQSVRAGHFAGRIVAWVGISLGLLCSGLALVAGGTPAFSGAGYVSAASGDSFGPHLVEQRLPEGYSPTYQNLSATFAAFAMIALVLVIVLLALPAANRFFRPPLPVSIPPYPGAAGDPSPATPAPGPMSGGAGQQSAAVHEQELAVLARRHQRGELTDAEFEAARRRLFDQP